MNVDLELTYPDGRIAVERLSDGGMQPIDSLEPHAGEGRFFGGPLNDVRFKHGPVRLPSSIHRDQWDRNIYLLVWWHAAGTRSARYYHAKHPDAPRISYEPQTD